MNQKSHPFIPEITVIDMKELDLYECFAII
jgi:hypothetical protein